MKANHDLLEIFKSTNALLEGHFRLSSGRHSNQYLQCAKILQYPRHARMIGERLAECFQGIQVDGVIAPAIGGILVAHEMAAGLGCRAIFGERENGVMTLRRGFEIGENEKYIVVEDVITTGKSTREIIQLVENSGGIVIGIGGIANRAQTDLDLPLEPKTLLRLTIENWDPSDCPLCKENVPIYTPGSRFAK